MVKKIFIFTLVFLTVFCATSVFAKNKDVVRVNSDIEVSRDTTLDNVVAVGGNVTVLGRVEGNVIAVGGSVFLKPASYVGEQVVAVGGSVSKDPSAEVGKKITEIEMPGFIPSMASVLGSGWLALWATISILALLGFLGLAVLFAALIPEHIGTAVNALEQSFVKMLLWGVLWVLLIVPIAVLLAISIIGIMLIPLEMLLAALALIIGYIASAIFIGKNILLAFKKFPPPLVDAILGILILFLIGFVPIIGPLVKSVFIIAGFGAVLATRFGTVK